MAIFRIALLIYIVVVTVVPQSSFKDCGRSFSGHRQPRNWTKLNEGRIINGKKSFKGAWPWQVSLQLLHPKFGLIGHWCGAVLIRPLWILTAAHCINNDLFNLPLASLWTAVLGDWDRDIEENTEVRIPIDKIIVHERFQNYQNDIAIMRLSKAVNFTTVCLPEEFAKYKSNTENTDSYRNFKTKSIEVSETEKENISPKWKWLTDQVKRISEKHQESLKLNDRDLKEKKSSDCIATGWGRYTNHGPMTSTLLQATVPLQDNSLCQAKYGKNIPIRNGHLCAGRLDGATGTCIGDSGGPLQCSLKDGRWFLAGITSFGSGCAKPGYPDVYTRLAFYIPWINKQIDAFSDAEDIYFDFLRKSGLKNNDILVHSKRIVQFD